MIVQVLDIVDMTDKEIDNLVSAIKRPGGMVANLNAGVAVAPANIANPGSTVANVDHRYLKLAVYYIRHKIRTSRDCIHADITIVNIKALLRICYIKDNHENTTDPLFIFEDDWPRSINAIDDYLGAYLGETGIPVKYVVHNKQDLPVDPERPNWYNTPQEEIIERARHYTETDPDVLEQVYVIDNATVWDILLVACRDLGCWSYIKPFRCTRDGRGA